ncbi:hypothetical protein XHC_1769 [Xanthomonas hortorum pv. carotae str. M081]|nr:hypothetical protein XHC_1769 [Xanthomonas hortorum pv. carotae str. M081]
MRLYRTHTSALIRGVSRTVLPTKNRLRYRTGGVEGVSSVEFAYANP